MEQSVVQQQLLAKKARSSPHRTPFRYVGRCNMGKTGCSGMLLTVAGAMSSDGPNAANSLAASWAYSADY